MSLDLSFQSYNNILNGRSRVKKLMYRCIYYPILIQKRSVVYRQKLQPTHLTVVNPTFHNSDISCCRTSEDKYLYLNYYLKSLKQVQKKYSSFYWILQSALLPDRKHHKQRRNREEELIKMKKDFR